MDFSVPLVLFYYIDEWLFLFFCINSSKNFLSLIAYVTFLSSLWIHLINYFWETEVSSVKHRKELYLSPPYMLGATTRVLHLSSHFIILATLQWIHFTCEKPKTQWGKENFSWPWRRSTTELWSKHRCMQRWCSLSSLWWFQKTWAVMIVVS